MLQHPWGRFSYAQLLGWLWEWWLTENYSLMSAAKNKGVEGGWWLDIVHVPQVLCLFWVKVSVCKQNNPQTDVMSVWTHNPLNSSSESGPRPQYPKIYSSISPNFLLHFCYDSCTFPLMWTVTWPVMRLCNGSCILFQLEGHGIILQVLPISVFFPVPSVAPDDVRCAGLTSQSLQVSWQPPPTSQCNGVLQGYKLFYEPVLDDHWQGEVEPTSCTEILMPGSSVRRKLKSAVLWDVMLHNPLKVHWCSSRLLPDHMTSHSRNCRFSE